MMRAPWTIWRFALVELWRLLALTTAVIVVVISFSLTVKFFAEGRLSTMDAIVFMRLTVIPMLQYALPFAAGFAATLTYHRMSQDNERIAAHGGGIGHASLLVPAAVTGVALALILALLVQFAIPRYLRAMQDVVGQSVSKLIVSSVRKREAIHHERFMVYADDVKALPNEGGAERLVLFGVVVAETDREGRVTGEASARRAWVSLSSRPPEESATRRGMTRVSVVLEDVVGRGATHRGEFARQTFEWAAPGPFDDDPKYLNWAELRASRDDPARYYNMIESRRQQLAYHIGEREVTGAIRGALRSEHRATLVSEDGQTFIIRAAWMDWTGKRWELKPVAGQRRITVERMPGTIASPDASRATIFQAATGGLVTDVGLEPSWTGSLPLHLSLESIAVTTASGEPAGSLESLQFRNLKFLARRDPMPELLAMECEALLSLAAERLAAREDAFIRMPAEDLRARLVKLDREIVSKQHERWAAAAACLVMVLAGAVTSLRLGGQMPLTVYLWSFFPALATLLTISTGQHITHHMGLHGLVVLWGGVGGLAAYTLGAYVLLRRH